jgi:phosphatidylglycerophosphate synthase
MPDSPLRPYSYAASVKSSRSDELINTWLLRPAAGLIVRVLYRTPVTPNQLTLASTVAGLVAAVLLLGETRGSLIAGGCCVTVKDLLDSADGQLARAKGRYSRSGRFLDSIGDFVVNVALFAALGAAASRAAGGASGWVLAAVGCLGILLRVSYHVFYHTSFLHGEEAYGTNRTTEEIRPEDLTGDPAALRLQRIFLLLYGWQDALMVRIDRWCAGRVLENPDARRRWYGDLTGVRISGAIGIGTELFVLMLFAVAGGLTPYLWWNCIVMNGIWGVSVGYRRVVLRRALGG